MKIDFPESVDSYRDFFTSISVDKALPPLPEISDDQLKIFLASRNVISEYYSIQRDELQLKRRTIRAPFNGTYKEVYLENGAYTNTGGRVARAIRTDKMELEVRSLIGCQVTAYKTTTLGQVGGCRARAGKQVPEACKNAAGFVIGQWAGT